VLNDAEYALVRVGRLRAKDRRRYERMLRQEWVLIDEVDDIKLLQKSGKRKGKRKRGREKHEKKGSAEKPAAASGTERENGEADRLAPDERRDAADVAKRRRATGKTHGELAPTNQMEPIDPRLREPGGSDEGP
jgi:hypothetical protein